MSNLSYEKAGVNYDRLDAFKRACQRAAASTVGALASHQLSEPQNIRGESAYLLESDTEYLAHVEEGLGSKNLVADAMQKLTGRADFYRNVGIDTVATIVNDLITVGALPVSVAMHAGVGDDKWFEDAPRAAALAEGFAEGCRQSNAVWGGGETPTLRGVIDPNSIVLAGSAVGRVKPKSNRLSGDVQDGDAIILLASTGVHTNGLTLCRMLAEKLPQGYLTKLDDGRAYGEALLDPSAIYVRFLTSLFAANIVPKYAVHITGHGWRKLMRLSKPMVYEINTLPPVPEVFRFIQKHGPVDTREAYATFNMGAGFAVYVKADQVDACLRAADKTGHSAWHAGTCRNQGGRKAVVIEPLGVTYEADTLQVR